jgi:3-oxoadipate enol-lactonase
MGMWDPQVVRLAARFRVVRYDMRGHGASDTAEGPYSFEMLAADVVALMDALHIAKAHFVGLSIGGMIGQYLGLLHGDRLNKLVLCSTTSRVPPEARPMWDERITQIRMGGMTTQVEATLERWFTPGFRTRAPETVGRIAATIQGTPASGVLGCAHAIRKLDVTGRLPQIKTPTLVMPGELDPGAPVAASQAIVERIPGASMYIVPGVRHLSNVEAPEAFNETLLAFLTA